MALVALLLALMAVVLALLLALLLASVTVALLLALVAVALVVLLALPLVAALLIVNLSLGILNRSAPQLTVFSVGFPTSLTLGLFLLLVLMTDFGRFLQGLFGQGLDFLQALVVALAGG